MAKELRPDREGAHRAAYLRNRRRVLATQNTCGICGQPVNMQLKGPNPLAPCVDHIIPIAKGGHPSDMDNLQLAHWSCNRQKSDKIFRNIEVQTPTLVGNRNLPQSADWTTYRSE